MNSDLPKVLHKVAAAPLLHHAMTAGRSLDPARTVVVTGHGAELVVGRAADRMADLGKRIARHAEHAEQAGARRLPFPIPGAMALASKVMKTIAYRL